MCRMMKWVPTCEAVASGILHDQAQVVVRQQHLLRLHDVHMALAKLRLNLRGLETTVVRTSAAVEVNLSGVAVTLSSLACFLARVCRLYVQQATANCANLLSIHKSASRQRSISKHRGEIRARLRATEQVCHSTRQASSSSG